MGLEGGEVGGVELGVSVGDGGYSLVGLVFFV